jgi:hypothetical protein
LLLNFVQQFQAIVLLEAPNFRCEGKALFVSTGSEPSDIVVPNIGLFFALEDADHKLVIRCKAMPDHLLTALEIECLIELVVNNTPDVYLAPGVRRNQETIISSKGEAQCLPAGQSAVDSPLGYFEHIPDLDLLLLPILEGEESYINDKILLEVLVQGTPALTAILARIVSVLKSQTTI